MTFSLLVVRQNTFPCRLVWWVSRPAALQPNGMVFMREIPLTKGKVALVDDSDFESLSNLRWQAMQKRNLWYAFRSQRKGGKKSTILMHRAIIGGIPRIDHRDGNGLNNQRGNLRAATRSQNQANSKKTTRSTTSRFKGVFRMADYQRWIARIKCNGKSRYLGSFHKETDAAMAYDIAARETFREFARTNFEV